MADQNAKRYFIGMKFDTREILGLLLTNGNTKHSEIQNDGFNMTDQNSKNYLIGMKFGTRGFLVLMIVNPSLTFRNSKCRMQYSGPKCKKQKIILERFLCGIHFLDYWYFVQMFIRGFFGSLIMNL